MKMKSKVHLRLKNIKVNHFMVMLVFEKEASKQGWSKEAIEAVLKEAKSGDYDHILKTIKQYCITPPKKSN